MSEARGRAATTRPGEASLTTEETTPAGTTSAPTADLGEDRNWWVDSGSIGGRKQGPRPSDSAECVLGQSIFAVGRGIDEDRARTALTGTNRAVLAEANPNPGEWAYVALVEPASPPAKIDKLRKALRLPRFARGVLVDSGTSVRAVATGDPVGERVVELCIGEESSFDAWEGGEWVAEKGYAGRNRLLRDAPALLWRHLRRRPGQAG